MNANLIPVFLVVTASAILVLVPLCHILSRREFQEYFPVFVAMASYLVVNLGGTISPNVLRLQRTPAFHVVFLATSACLFATYALLRALRQRIVLAPLPGRLAASARAAVDLLPRSWMLFGLAVAAMFAVFAWVTPPLFLRFNLFGRWPGIVAERVALVLGGSFHWYALAFFEAPLFLVIFSGVNRAGLSASARPKDAGGWARLRAPLLAVALVGSVYFLNKQYVIYLLFAIMLLRLIFANRMRLRTVLIFGALALAVLVALYGIYVGPHPGETLRLILHRTSEVYAWASAVVFDMFPSEEGFLHGRSMINVFHLLPYEYVSVADMVYPRIYGDVGYGSAPVPAIFESYANFGVLGILLSLAVIVWLVVLIQIASWSGDVLIFSLSAYWTVKLILIWQGPFWFGVLEPSLVFFTLVILLFYRLRVGGMTSRIGGTQQT